MKAVTFIRRMDGFKGDARLYQLSENCRSDDGIEYDHIIVSAANCMFTGPETYIFPADKNGNVIDWGELEGSQRGALDHESILIDAGYAIIPPTAQITGPGEDHDKQ